MRLTSFLAAFVLLVLTSGCAIQTEVISSTLNVPPGSQFTFEGTKIDDRVWTEQPEWQTKKLRKYGDRWIPELEEAFTKYASKYGIAGAGTPVRATITEFNPGNRALRAFWGGYGAGHATITVMYDCGSCGSFGMRGRMRGGFYGGSIESLMRWMGYKAAKFIAKNEDDDYE